MAITDLTGYTWVGNDNIDLTHFNLYTSFSLTFTSNNNTYYTLVFSDPSADYDYNTALSYIDLMSANYVYEGYWYNSAYKTIQITGGTDATNSTLIAWLEANGTLTAPQPTDTNKISVGTLKLAKAFIGNSEVASMWLGNVKVYEKASSYDYNYSNGTLTINNAPYNYNNGVLTIE